MSNFLAGDIGGTKTRLAVISVSGTQVQVVHEAGYPSRDYATFEALLGDFLSDTKSSFSDNSDRAASHSTKLAKNASQIDGYLPHAGERDAVSLREFHFNHAAFGVAGPVQGRVVQATNLPWCIDADILQQQFGFAHCTLLNDLEATAYGLPALGEDDLLTLQAGASDASGNAAVIAAGTGLGEAGLFWDGQHHYPFATEGGHASFSPGDELEIAFLRHLGETTSHSTKLQKTAAKSLVIQQQHRHVSWERVVSGMGLLSLHEFLCLHCNAAVPQWLMEEMQSGDAAASISAAALSGRDEICVETLARFVRLYGAEAGNLALKVMSCGGLYLGGGIAPKILPLLQNGAFLDAFLNKGRMRPLLEAMPVKVILNDRAALFGPALRAAQLAKIT